MKENVTLVPSEKCTGCSACQNICPVDAIQMKPDEEGFIMPSVDEEKCIDCGKCVKQCPALHILQDNNKNPTLYAAMANDEIRLVSSSGGMFTLAANEIFKQGGVVCGAAFDKNMTLSHRIIDSPEQMSALRGSKYVQSDINTVYREIKRHLLTGRKVLFTGTPCQVAGLYAYLEKKYSELYTIDVLCHGVPSQQVFSKYLSEISEKNSDGRKRTPKVINAKFRDKKFGWTAETIRVEFENGKVYEKNLKNNDPFEFIFLRNVALRKSCENCPFSTFPRQGDMTVGDFWGISKIDISMTDNKGTSLVYINNEHGEELFGLMRPKMKKVKELKVPAEKIGNRIRANFPANKNRERFLHLVQSNSVEAAVKKIRADVFDVGLVSNFYALNFGGTMTQYALYHVLEDMGYSALMIERPGDAQDASKIVNNLEKIFVEKPFPEYAIAPQYKNKEAMRQLNRKCGTFVVGSDQLFQYELFRLLGKFVTLDWVSDTKKKVAYAASYGHEDVWGESDVHAEMAYFMQKFDAFSVREESGVKISKEQYGVDAEWVLDPVFLCDTKHYHALANKATRKVMPHFIGGYILDPSTEKQNIFKYAMDKLSLPCEIFSEYYRPKEYTAPLGDLNVAQLKTEERLQTIINCDFFITDSFHGTCFSIIMKKPFISIINKERGADRFKSLLSMLHLENRLIESEKDLDRPDLFSPIDYDAVYAILDKEKARCKKWLSDALKRPKRNFFSDYDMMKKLIDSQNAKIEELSKIISQLVSESDLLKYKTDILEYLRLLNEQKNDKLIVISVKDTPGLALNSAVAEKLNKVGVTANLSGKHSRSYIAVLNNGSLVHENLGKDLEPSVYKAKVSNHDLYVESKVYRNGNLSVIRLNGKDYSLNRRGLNIAVFDSQSGELLDSVVFDTHVKSFDCSR